MRALATLVLFLVCVDLIVPVGALACIPPPDPTIAALGPGQLVVVGTTGERVAAGRQFHVERWYGDGVPRTPITIAFKEGEPVGDCSYLVRAGQRLLIAPMRLDDGTLSADLGTLQADPTTEQGRAFLAEAEALFGPGRIPAGGAELGRALPDDVITLAVILGVFLAGFAFVTRRQRDG